MPIDLNKPMSLNALSREEVALLRDLQGNILKGHGRAYALHLFLRFDPTHRSSAWEFIGRIVKRISSAATQIQDSRRYKKTRMPGNPMLTLSLSAAGYQALGIKPECWPGQEHDAFRLGMTARNEILSDPDVRHWDPLYHSPVHAMILVADDRESVINEIRIQIKKILPESITLLGEEVGRVLKNSQGDGIEHFGYVDGRSQPLFFQEDVDRENQNGDGISLWNPAAPLGLALTPCPGGQANTSFGSYLVFRKLEQNVQRFKELERALGEALRLEDEERAGALIVGRFEDGTPVVLQHSAGMCHPVPNNFHYVDDAEGGKCPFQAHIRKINPRGDSVGTRAESLEIERSHRIVRRGIPYGRRKVDRSTGKFLDQPAEGVGLLFMCYQQSIENQFEYLQKEFANNENSLHRQAGEGIDPLIGQGRMVEQSWPPVWGSPDAHSFQLAPVVSLKGGEYFFTPSISFLNRMTNEVLVSSR